MLNFKQGYIQVLNVEIFHPTHQLFVGLSSKNIFMEISWNPLTECKGNWDNKYDIGLFGNNVFLMNPKFKLDSNDSKYTLSPLFLVKLKLVIRINNSHDYLSQCLFGWDSFQMETNLGKNKSIYDELLGLIFWDSWRGDFDTRKCSVKI